MVDIPENGVFKVRRGNAFTFTSYVQQPTEADPDVYEAYDLTNCTMKFTVKKDPSNTNANARIGPLSATISDVTSGVGVFTFSETDTDFNPGDYWYDVLVENSVTGFKFTSTMGKFILLPSVTRS